MAEIPTIEQAQEDLAHRLQELEQELDKEFAIEMAGMFVNDTPELIDAIQKSIDAKDSALLAQTAHKLKGSSLNLGATRLAAFCLELELLGKSGAPIPQGTSVASILEEFQHLKQFLLQYSGKQ
jgi:HPt (histidine-containing phosphotransfer) domain-containing protein